MSCRTGVINTNSNILPFLLGPYYIDDPSRNFKRMLTKVIKIVLKHNPRLLHAPTVAPTRPRPHMHARRSTIAILDPKLRIQSCFSFSFFPWIGLLFFKTSLKELVRQFGHTGGSIVCVRYHFHLLRNFSIPCHSLGLLVIAWKGIPSHFQSKGVFPV